MVAVDGGVGRVVREQPGVPVAPLERLDRGLVIEERRDDLAVVGGRLTSYDDPVAIADGRVDHRLADHLEQEELAIADDLARQREDGLDGFLGEDRSAGCDAAKDGHVGGGRCGVTHSGDVGGLSGGSRLVGDDKRAGAVGVAAQESLALQHAQLMGDARGGGEAYCLADLADAGRVAPLLDGAANDGEDVALAGGEPLAEVGFGLAAAGHGSSGRQSCGWSVSDPLGSLPP